MTEPIFITTMLVWTRVSSRVYDIMPQRVASDVTVSSVLSFILALTTRSFVSSIAILLSDGLSYFHYQYQSTTSKFVFFYTVFVHFFDKMAFMIKSVERLLWYKNKPPGLCFSARTIISRNEKPSLLCLPTATGIARVLVAAQIICCKMRDATIVTQLCIHCFPLLFQVIIQNSDEERDKCSWVSYWTNDLGFFIYFQPFFYHLTVRHSHWTKWAFNIEKSYRLKLLKVTK